MPKYKLTADGRAIELGTDGHPIVIDDAGKEFTIDAINAQAKINTIVSESNERRKLNSELQTKLKAYEGIEDPAAALSALQTVKSLGEDHKVKMDELKNTINKTWESKLQEWEQEKTGLNDKLFQATVLSKFATSEVIKKTVLTPDIAATFFGKHFNPDGTAKDTAGNLIYSKSKPGEPAQFDEAIEVLIDTYPNKDSILRGSGAQGGDGHRGGSGGSGFENKSSVDLIKAGLAARRA
jgi:hypothetical protein